MTVSSVRRPIYGGDPTGVIEVGALLGIGFDRCARPMLVVDQGIRTVFANSAAGRLFEVESFSLVGQRTVDMTATHRTDQTDTETAAFRDGGLDHLERETTQVTTTGGLRQVELVADLVTTSSGRRLFLIQMLNVTEDHLRQQQLSSSELRYRQLTSNLPRAAIVMFDHDLRVVLAFGEVLSILGQGPDFLEGRLMCDVLPVSVLRLLEPAYRSALAGESLDFEFICPIHGGQFHIQVRPVIGPDGTVVSGMATSEDVSQDRGRASRLRQIQSLTPFGSCQYDPRDGWVFDDELLNLWGVDSAVDPLEVINDLVLPQDRAVATEAWARVLAHGGRTSPQYRIRHSKSDQVRYLKSTCEAVVDGEGRLIRAIATHVDVSDAVAARQAAENAEAEAVQERTVLRQVNDAVATTNSSLGEVTESPSSWNPADHGSAPLVVQMTRDQQTVERGLVVHRDEQRRLSDDTGNEAHSIAVTADVYSPSAHKLSTPGGPAQSPDGSTDDETRHYIVAPVRHEGSVLGLLSIFRTPDSSFEQGDQHPVQLLADRVGSALAERRLREVRHQERVEHQAVADRLLELTYEQRELLEQLASTETRERALLAEAVHDDPMQLIVAAILRIDNVRLHVAGERGDELDRVASLLETSVERLRKIIVAITPPDLSNGLGVALRNLAEGIFIGTTSEVTVLGPNHVRLTPPATATAYRILREALVNARKHALARHVTVRLEEHDGTVMLSLTDDGVGAESLKTEPGHLGVATMRARADAENAQLDLNSTPGIGTTVVLTLPVADRGLQ